MNDLSHMQLFVRIVEEGSFSAAARYLGITPSAVSRQVSRLESELGGRLFQRTTRRQNLTEAGETYFQYAYRIVEDLEAARLAVTRLTDTPSGTLHVTVEADFALAFIAPILPKFLNRYPEVHVRLHMSAGLLDLVHEGIDVAIRVGHLDDSSLVARKLSMSHSLVCASPAYLAHHGTPTHPSDLSSHSCLSFRTRPGKNQWTFESPDGVIDVPISGRLNVNGLVFLRNAARDGLGIIMIPTWMMNDEHNSGQLISILEDFPVMPPSTPIHAVFAHNRQLAPKIRAFVDFLAERMATL